jgi:hypothetical protein
MNESEQMLKKEMFERMLKKMFNSHSFLLTYSWRTHSQIFDLRLSEKGVLVFSCNKEYFENGRLQIREKGSAKACSTDWRIFKRSDSKQD